MLELQFFILDIIIRIFLLSLIPFLIDCLKAMYKDFKKLVKISFKK